MQNYTQERLYFESHSLDCSIHCLNNVLQGAVFTQQDFDDVVKSLPPHIQSETYDVNVMTLALNQRGYTTMYFNKANDPAVLKLDNILGFMVNTVVEAKFFGVTFCSGSHWAALRQVNRRFYNLDSDCRQSDCIARNKPDMLEYLRRVIADDRKHLFLVLSKDVDKHKSWRSKSAKK